MRLAFSFCKQLARQVVVGVCTYFAILVPCCRGYVFSESTLVNTHQKSSVPETDFVCQNLLHRPPGLGELAPRSECPSGPPKVPEASWLAMRCQGCACRLSTAIVSTSDMAYRVRRDRDSERAPLARSYGTSPTLLSFHVALCKLERHSWYTHGAPSQHSFKISQEERWSAPTHTHTHTHTHLLVCFIMRSVQEAPGPHHDAEPLFINSCFIEFSTLLFRMGIHHNEFPQNYVIGPIYESLASLKKNK